MIYQAGELYSKLKYLTLTEEDGEITFMGTNQDWFNAEQTEIELLGEDERSWKPIQD